MKFLFGPVPSRRLGLSLGIDLLPSKTCSLDCVYCECGATSILTMVRKQYYPVADVLAELKDYLDKLPTLDYVTFSGSGEPTLYKGLDQIVSYLKINYPQYKVALLTNSTLFHLPEVRSEVRDIDLIIPSIDAVTLADFISINRPCSNIDLEAMLQGLLQLRKEYHGQLWAEVFIVPGINDQPASLRKLKEYLEQLKPDNIQLNRLDRPGTEISLKRASDADLQRIAKYLDPLPVEKIKAFQRHKLNLNPETLNTIRALLQKRYISLNDLEQLTGLSQTQLKFMIMEMRDELIVHNEQGQVFFKLRV